MKHLLILPFALASLLGGAMPALAGDPGPKMVYRPIPGLSGPVTAAPVEFEAEPQARAAPAPVPLVELADPNRARILYIHRRATLPEQFIRDLPESKPVNVGTSSAAPPVPVAQGKIKIIPKDQVAQLQPPPAPREK